MATKERLISAVIHDDGSLHFSSVMSPAEESVAVCYTIPDRIIPVIFIPGVMESNRATDESDNSQSGWLLDSTNTVQPWMTKDALTRRNTLDPTKARIAQYVKGSYLEYKA
ncbi:hypothetical protein ASG35_09325 [Burkholderia sp. Leaf177]|uniref:hypothetical protein n=1 Tax=Burkholderia sp. Leaf177 TaxID=1736287 RepID=UPI0006FA26D2|nr:hypothetical protein [Burkholderia sp. Leaf177]KQR78599.1 hypothetical protein ASG35_09325 [Burkholderia sp. Leaf177]